MGVDLERTYIRKRKVLIEEVLPYIGVLDKIEIDEHPVKLKSARYQVFQKSTVCTGCGLVGSHFWMEKHRHSGKGQNSDAFHLNLYGVNSDGEEVMMTKDHIVPLGRGGENYVRNMQTMCFDCNQKKADKI